MMNSYQSFATNYAIYPDNGTGQISEVMYLTLGLVGEAGEVAEKIKKFYRDGTLDNTALAHELGDVLWYLSQLAQWAGFKLTDIADMNLAKLSDRMSRNVLSGSGDTR